MKIGRKSCDKMQKMKIFAENFPIGPPPDIAKEARPCIVPEDLDLSIVAGIDDGILSERYCRDDGILRFHGVALFAGRLRPLPGSWDIALLRRAFS